MSYKEFYSLNGISLYKDSFQLKNIRDFFKFIEKSDKLNFLPYTLLFEEIPSTDSLSVYRVEIIFIPQTPFIMVPFSDLICLNRCVIRYSKKEREVTIEAGTGGMMLLALAGYCLLSFVMLFIALILSSVLPLVFAILSILIPVSVYIRDVRRLDTIKEIASGEVNL